ncbi:MULTISPECIES: type III polyketide synthase [unclassified Arthrobacter]|uniref:type III polyketide synthase n=1 Tax=unclassified Arthrobacter TaxID=235627 RepID=UPI001D13EF70|nr:MULTISPECIES: type III polyketide synthase [unclassified Arthrobacter]MCC3276625.1 type III polyketide synthase [Arthrobacter sp. zg-Y20]MCC3279836.1 type III polyketide synthase [Arthrobacter sp. zg-Y40]MCC9178407.1 type III polyketide synthase [Arthrobacter sp. zg-Y750]MDK1316785.1 type III polyketide synthase [Arthrobacter sp. zg.Y20]MDK1328203.1 type III polyketide synthase [Arthrobacter sp. zg-Y1143]
MTVTLRSLETAIPPTVLVQTEVRDCFATQPGLTRLGERLVRTCFDSAAIDTRRTALAELSLTDTSEHPVFYDARSGLLLKPSTKVRNDIFAVQATKLFIEAATKALAAAPGVTAADITHVITVSCTGFFNPGPDYKVVRALGLDPSVQRYHLGFMGCYAAFPAMRAAKSFCEADPGAVVLVVSAELCSLHVRTSNDPDAIMGSSLFADGAAAAVITARDDLPEGPGIQLDHFETILTPVGEEAMAWNIGDEGFEMVLGTYVPHIIDDHIVGALDPLLAHDDSLGTLPYREIEHWAIHPGGRSILDKVEAKLELSEEQLFPARETLRTVGNMSSATVLFVLKRILDLPSAGGNERICSMAFGPGLTVETGLFTRVGVPVQPAAAVAGERAEQPAVGVPA